MRTRRDDDDDQLVHRDDEAVDREYLKFGKIGGKARGVAPKKSWPVYSRKSDMPIAVMSTLSVGPPRSGR